MEKVAPNSNFVGHSIEIICQSKIKWPLQSKDLIGTLVPCLLQVYYYFLANRSFLKEVPFFCMVA